MAAAAKKAASSAKRGDVTTVSAPLVQVQLGNRIVHLYQGDIVPDGVDADSLAHLKDLGYVTEGDAPAESEDDE